MWKKLAGFATEYLEGTLRSRYCENAKKESQKNISNKTDIGWGHQIRSYVLQPYRLVKDLRTEEESTNPEDVLNGNIEKFLESSLFRKKWKK